VTAGSRDVSGCRINNVAGIVFVIVEAGIHGARGGSSGRDYGVTSRFSRDTGQVVQKKRLCSPGPPKREAYSGDIFSIHAHLLERATCLNVANDGGNMTVLPTAEMKLGGIALKSYQSDLHYG